MDRALGCLLGVAVGDAAGATLEGRAAQLIPPAAAQAAMRMPGSAIPYLGKGQVTDDTELTICLARGEMGGWLLPWGGQLGARELQRSGGPVGGKTGVLYCIQC